MHRNNATGLIPAQSRKAPKGKSKQLRLPISLANVAREMGAFAMTTEPVLSIDGLRKAYPGVVANDDVSFSVGAGEVHALLGENGAGKSTLVKMVYGLVRPDAGHMRFAGQTYAPQSPQAARQTGIAMVFQHFSLFDALDVAENVALGMEDPPPMSLLGARIREVSETYGLPLDPSRQVGDLSLIHI